jgi:hypothetical protein
MVAVISDALLERECMRGANHGKKQAAANESPSSVRDRYASHIGKRFSCGLTPVGF